MASLPLKKFSSRSWGRTLSWATIVVLHGTVLGSTALSSTAALAQTPAPAAAPAPSRQTDHPASTQSPVPADSDPKTQVTVLEDTLIRVMTNAPLNSKQAKDGMPLLFTVSQDVVLGDVLAIPSGATVHGVVIQSKKPGVLTGSPELTLKLVSLDLGGRSYPLYTYLFRVKGTSKTRPTETKAKDGAVVGAIAGGVFGGSAKGETTAVGKVASMATGAAIGAGVGTMVSAATPGPGIWIPSEAQVDFYLASPITVTAVSAKEAARLGQGLHPGGPALYIRGDLP